MLCRISIASLVMLAAFTGLVGKARGDGYVLTDLGSLPGLEESYATAINNHGQIVGFSANGRAFLWEDGVMTDLGTLGGAFSYAEDINDLGQVVGEADLPGGGGSHAFLWENGVMTDLGPSGGVWSAANAINNVGQIAGVTFTPGSADPSHVVLWEGGVLRDLGFWGAASDINDLGEIVGHTWAGDGFIWRDGSVYVIGGLGGNATAAIGINERSQVVGWSRTSEGNDAAFLWEAGQTIDIGTPFGFPNSSARAVNDDGVVVGNPGFGHAFIHRESATRDLHELTACGAGREIREANDLNDAGQIVVTVVSWDGAQQTASAGLLTPADVVPCRKGNVGMTLVDGLPMPRGLADVVFVGGSSGDPVERRLEVAANVPATLRVEPAPDVRSPQYAVWIYEGESRECTDVEIFLPRKGRFLLGHADRCLPVANSIAPGSCAGPGMDLFGLGRPAGVTSRDLMGGNPALFSLNGAPGFPLAPVDFTVTFPPGTFTVYSIVRDPHAMGPLKISIGNAIVVESIP